MNHESELIYEALGVSKEKFEQLNDYFTAVLSEDESIPDRKSMILDTLFNACDNEAEKILATYMFSRWFQWFTTKREESDVDLESNTFIK